MLLASPALRLATLLFAAALSAHAQPAQPSYRLLTVRVTDDGTQAPLPGARVTVAGMADRDWTTDAEGSVLLAVPRGARALLQVRRIGYAPATVPSPAGSDSAGVTVALRRAVQALDTSKVLAENRSEFLAGFESRRARGNGAATFITREQIEQRMSIRTIDIVRRAVGTRVIDSAGVLLVASSRGSKPVFGALGSGKASTKGGDDLAPCVMRIAVDGSMREWGFSLDEIEPKEIHGIEVYPGPATIPVQFGGLRKDAACGLVMIWTRRGP
ncbi:MAG: carboxypeptidase-like regulatory domain-containing protein [Gemmatimonadaceae bacterium]